MKLEVLYIEDNRLDVELVSAILAENGLECSMTVVEAEEELRTHLAERRYDLILSDCSLPAYNGIAALAVARELCPEIPFIFVSGTLGEELAIECVKCGATDYVLKDRLSRLPPVVRRAMEEVHARERHEQTREELERTQAAFYQSQKMETIGRLTAGIAHDFNNLLTVIHGYAELIRSLSDKTGKMHGYAAEVLTAAQRAADLVEQLMLYSRNQKVSPIVLSANDEIARIGKILAKLVGERVAIEVATAADLWPIEIDPVRFDQVILNLAANARDAMAEGGKLRIETANRRMDAETAAAAELAPGDYVVVSVEDNGIGMGEETLRHVFEPFFTTKEPGKGTGLGLASAEGIVKQSGGSISVWSKPGVGTRLDLCFPRATKSATGGSALGAESPLGSGDAVLAGTPHATLLVVDDDQSLLSFMELVLRNHDYAVLAARSAEEALETARGADVDLLVTDVVLPDGSGLELWERVGELHPGLPALLTSGYSLSVLDGLGISRSRVRIVPKPVSVQFLLMEVRAALDHRAASR